METSVVTGLKSGLKALVTRIFVSGVLGTVLFVQPAWSAINITPSPSTNGAYTVSWASTLGCSTFYDDFGIPWEICYSLQESGPTSGYWTSGSSINFSSKPSGTYTYKVNYRLVSYYWGVDTTYTVEGPTSVNVCTTYTVPYYSGWVDGQFRSPYSGSCTWYYEGFDPWPPADWQSPKWCDAQSPVPQTGTVQICS